MAKLSDLEIASRRYLERYPFPKLDAPPLTRISKPIHESKIAVVTTSGLHLDTDKPFSTFFASSDCSFRKIETDINRSRIKISHTSKEFDRSGVNLDLNIVLPIDRLKELVSSNKLGAVADCHYSFMGSLPRVGNLKRKTAKEVAKLMLEENVDIVLLTPV